MICIISRKDNNP